MFCADGQDVMKHDALSWLREKMPTLVWMECNSARCNVSLSPGIPPMVAFLDLIGIGAGS
jgi:hypothetical protein